MSKFFNELKRRNVIKAAIAYAIVAWVLVQILSIVLPSTDAPEWVMKTIMMLMIIGFPVWVLISWVYEITPEGLKKTRKSTVKGHRSSHINNRLNILLAVSLSVAIGFILYNQFWNKPINILIAASLAVAIGFILYNQFWNKSNIESVLNETEVKSIAVLAFTNMSADESQNYFCDGIAEDIINDLFYVEGLRVTSRTSSFLFKDKNIDIREIGKKLNVQTVLEGSVQKSGNTLRITTQLINVSDGYHIWSKRYERELKDIFEIQSEIAQNIAQVLKITLSKKEKNEIEKIKTKNITAYDYYMRGRDYYNKVYHDKVLLSIPMFEKAIQTDSNYVLAYVGLANSYSFLHMYFEGTAENLNNALKASKKALELNSELSESHSSRAIALSQSKQYKEAEKEFKLARQLNPKLFEAYYQNGRLFKSLGKHKEAAELFKQASLIEPDNYNPIMFLARTYKDLRMEDEMLKANKQTIKVLMKHLEFNPDDSRALYLGAAAFIVANETEKALAWIEKAISLKPDEITVLYNAACTYSLLNKTDEALNYFERAIETGYASRNWIENDSDLDNIRNHPRFKSSLNKIK